MANNNDRAQRWMDRALGREDRDLGRNGNVFYDGDRIYSYGYHFEMARVMRDSNGEPSWVLVNGDSYSPTTSQHQGMVRGVIARTHLPSIIIPHTAMAGAGIDHDSIEIIDVRPDRTETLNHSAREVSGEHILMDDPEGRTEEYETLDYSRRLSSEELPPHGGYARVKLERPLRVPDPERRRVSANSYTVAWWDKDALLWRWTTERHYLGDSLFWARANGRRARYLSSFDYQEARPLYFLCELPRVAVNTVEEAYEALKPNAVKEAEAMGLTCSRQGDMFAIPTELTTKEAKGLTPFGKGRIVKRPRGGLLGTNHTASEVLFATEDRVYARGLLYHEPQGWGRDPDHARRKMGDGKTWHLLIRNTVPRQKETRDAHRSLS